MWKGRICPSHFCGVIPGGIILGVVIGGVLGFAYDVWMDSAAVEAAQKRGEFVDGLLPVAPMVLMPLGSILGAIIMPFLLGLWVATRGLASSNAKSRPDFP